AVRDTRLGVRTVATGPPTWRSRRGCAQAWLTCAQNHQNKFSQAQRPLGQDATLVAERGLGTRFGTALLDFLDSDRAKRHWGHCNGVRCVIGWIIWFCPLS